MLKPFFIISIIFCFCLSCNQQKEKKIQDDKLAATVAVIDSSLEDISHSRSVAKLMCQRWENRNDYALSYLGENDEDDVPMRSFCFFDNGTVVASPRDKMQMGKWVYNDATKELEITLAAGAKKIYKIMTISYKKMLLLQEGEEKTEEYKADGIVHKEKVNDPFYSANLEWMIKPTHTEADSAVHNRIKACIHFYHLFYDDMVKRNAKQVFFFGLPGCFEWYDGGLSLKKENELTKKWKNIFFNANDAHKGYSIMDKLTSEKYEWLKGNANWVELNADVLKQMEQRINKIN